MASLLILRAGYLHKIRSFEFEALNLIICAHNFNFMGQKVHIKSERDDSEHIILFLCARKVDFMGSKCSFYVSYGTHNIRSLQYGHEGGRKLSGSLILCVNRNP